MKPIFSFWFGFVVLFSFGSAWADPQIEALKKRWMKVDFGISMQEFLKANPCKGQRKLVSTKIETYVCNEHSLEGLTVNVKYVFLENKLRTAMFRYQGEIGFRNSKIPTDFGTVTSVGSSNMTKMGQNTQSFFGSNVEMQESYVVGEITSRQRLVIYDKMETSQDKRIREELRDFTNEVNITGVINTDNTKAGEKVFTRNEVLENCGEPRSWTPQNFPLNRAFSWDYVFPNDVPSKPTNGVGSEVVSNGTEDVTASCEYVRVYFQSERVLLADTSHCPRYLTIRNSGKEKCFESLKVPIVKPKK